VIEVFNVDGSMQSVSLHSQVRADEVVGAIARRQNTDVDVVPFYSLFLVTIWRLQIVGTDQVSKRLELKKLLADDRPLKIKAAGEIQAKEGIAKEKQGASTIGKTLDIRVLIGFAFLDEAGEQLFRQRGEEIIMKSGGEKRTSPRRGVKQQVQQAVQQERIVRQGFSPINSIGKGDMCGYLFQRSAANPREWQRRWCILQKADLIHCLSNMDHSDAKYVPLHHNMVKPIQPRDLGGLKHCFEIDTPHDVIQFRAKTDEEAKSWIFAIERNMNLASENEKLHLAERMVEDGQRSLCCRDEAIVENALGSLEGLLSTQAGADRLFRFAKRSYLGSTSARHAELVAFHLDLDSAYVAFSSISDTNILSTTISSNNKNGLPPRTSSFASSSGSSAAGSTSLRGNAAMLSRKEWMAQICERFAGLFEDPGQVDADQDTKHVLSATQKLRSQLADDHLTFIPTESCAVLIEEIRRVVFQAIERDVYQAFKNSKEYYSVIATIPNRLRKKP